MAPRQRSGKPQLSGRELLESLNATYTQTRVAWAIVAPTLALDATGMPKRQIPATIVQSDSTCEAIAQILRSRGTEVMERAHRLEQLEHPPVTSAEAAKLLRVRPGTIHTLVKRGKLTPLNPGATRHIFAYVDVVDYRIEGDRPRGGDHGNSGHARRAAAYEAAHGERPPWWKPDEVIDYIPNPGRRHDCRQLPSHDASIAHS
jgi:hypothetical protein